MEVRAGLAVLTIGVLAGELLASRWLPPPALLAALPLAALATWRAGGRRAPVLLWTALSTFALGVGATRMHTVVRPVLPADHVAHLPLPLRTTLTGRVVEGPERRERRTVLLVAAEAVGSRPASGLVRVTLRDARRPWGVGQRLEVETTLRAPRNFANPGSFDWVGHLARRGIRVTTFVWDEASMRRLPGRGRDVQSRLARWRARLARTIAAVVPRREGAVLQALVVGEEGGIDADLRNAFTRAGVVHVLSISGLHIGLVAVAGFVGARWLLARSTWLLLRLDAERLAAALSLGPVLFYTALAGFQTATLRSAAMVGAAVAATLVGRRVDVVRTLLLAALALALLWPGIPLDIDFQLSFVSVAAIVVGTRRWGGTRPPGAAWGYRLRTVAIVSASALVGTAPLLAFHFHQISLAGLIANPIAVPLFGSVVVVLGLAGALLAPISPGGAALAFRLAGVVLQPAIGLVERMARPSWAALDVPIPSLFELALLHGLLGGLVLLPRLAGKTLVGVALVGLVADASWWARERFWSPALRVTFLDVGQGDAAVAELPGGGVLVVDAGGFPGSDFDTGAAVVSPFLYARKIRRIDALVMTHAHPDHAGGLAYLLVHHRPREFWWTGVPGEGLAWQRLQAAIAASGVRVRVLAAGSPLPGLVRVLHPPDGAHDLTLNDSSLTLRLDLGAVGVLLTGDIEARAETALLRAPESLAAAVLKVPHHGSRTSSTPGFVGAVAPRVAVVSVGADNRYRLPAAEVEERYRARGACVLRTDRCGAIITATDGRRLAVRTARPACACPALTTGPDRWHPAIAEAQGMQIAPSSRNDGLVREDPVVARIFVDGMAARHGNDSEGRELAEWGAERRSGSRRLEPRVRDDAGGGGEP